MFCYVAPVMICGSCGYSLVCVDEQPYNAAKKKGRVQVICRHRECGDYDKPMEFDLPTIELSPTTDERVLAAMMDRGPNLVFLNS